MNSAGSGGGGGAQGLGIPGRVLPILVLALVGCGVTPEAAERAPAPDGLPRLRRASYALQEHIAREKEHVEAYTLQLETLRSREDELYASVVEAEQTYQRLQADVGAVQRDVAAVEGELANAQQTLAAARVGLEEARLARAAAEGELQSAAAAAAEAAALTAIWRQQWQQDEQQLQASRGRLEGFRIRWGIPAETWRRLFLGLGLGPLVGAEAAPPAAPEQAAGTTGAGGEGSPSPQPDHDTEGGGSGA